jgi:hypothetical protein
MGLSINLKRMCCAVTCLFSLHAFAQEPPKNWQLLDYKTNSVYGLSVEKAYLTLLKNKKAKKKVIVALIDVGMDMTHPAFKGSIWTNKKEIEGNGIDDDGNGYIDDLHGWNFIGDCQVETYDCVREYVKFRKTYEHATDTLKPEAQHWLKMKREAESLISDRRDNVNRIAPIITSMTILNAYWKKTLNMDSLIFKDLLRLKLPSDADTSIVRAHTKVLPFNERYRHAQHLHTTQSDRHLPICIQFL